MNQDDVCACQHARLFHVSKSEGQLEMCSHCGCLSFKEVALWIQKLRESRSKNY